MERILPDGTRCVFGYSVFPQSIIRIWLRQEGHIILLDKQRGGSTVNVNC